MYVVFDFSKIDSVAYFRCLIFKEKLQKTVLIFFLIALIFAGVVLHHSGFDEFQLIGSHLAQRLFDPVPVVRLSVSKGQAHDMFLRFLIY